MSEHNESVIAQIVQGDCLTLDVQDDANRQMRPAEFLSANSFNNPLITKARDAIAELFQSLAVSGENIAGSPMTAHAKAAHSQYAEALDGGSPILPVASTMVDATIAVKDATNEYVDMARNFEAELLGALTHAVQNMRAQGVAVSKGLKDVRDATVQTQTASSAVILKLRNTT